MTAPVASLLDDILSRGGALAVADDYTLDGYVPPDLERIATAAGPHLVIELIARRYGLTLGALIRACADYYEWHNVSQDPEAVEALALAIATERDLLAGIVPEHYTAMTHCHGCGGTVAIFPDAPTEVTACPWCVARARRDTATDPDPIPVPLHDPPVGAGFFPIPPATTTRSAPVFGRSR